MYMTPSSDVIHTVDIMDIKMRDDGMDWINVAQDTDRRPVIVNAIMKLCVL